MSWLNRVLALFFVFLMLSGLIVLVTAFTPAVGQEGFKPSVPEFSFALVNNPIVVPPVTSTDPYTGIITYTSGYSTDNWTIEFSIKNQPFTPYTNADGAEVNLYYSIESKGRFEKQWKESAGTKAQPDTEYTIVSTTFVRSPVGGQIDYRVIASVGYYRYAEDPDHPTLPVPDVFMPSAYSDYSDVVTVTRPGVSFTRPSQTSWPSSSVPGDGSPWQSPTTIFTNPVFVIFFVCIIIIPIVIILYHNKHHQQGKTKPCKYKPQQDLNTT
jgi:hypothetical protein